MIPDPIDVNRIAETLGLTGRDIPPEAWPLTWDDLTDPFGFDKETD